MQPEAVNPPTTQPAWLKVPGHWPAQTDLLDWCQQMGPATAALMILAGVVYLLWGWYLFKGLVTLNAALLGAYVGAMIGQRTDAVLAGGFVGGIFAALIAWPLMNYAVAVMGGIFGAILGASIWRLTGLEPRFGWAGGMTGLVAFGMLSFVLFRASVMMYTSLQGSVMLIFGLLGLIYKYQDLARTITENVALKPLLLPIAIFIPMMIGLIYQQAHIEAPAAADDKK